MLGALLGLSVWMLFFLVVALGFFGQFEAIDVIFTWVQVPIVAIALLLLYESGIPGGAGELKKAFAWIRAHDPDESIDFSKLPANTVVVGLEIGAGTLALVGLVLSTVFSMSISIAAVGAFGRNIFDPASIAVLGIQASEAFGLFLAGALLWHVAMFVEASSLV